MKDEIANLIGSIVKDLGAGDVIPVVEVPENSEHGEYTTNVALRLTKHLKKKPMDIADLIKNKLLEQKQHQNTNHQDQKTSGKTSGNSVLRDIERVEVVAPGFINIFLTEAKLSTELVEVLNDKEAYGTSKTGKGKQVMVEYAHPNTHKAFHIGHLRNITTGESIIRLLETTGYKVIRANYEGDVGMHIAKAIYALLYIEPYKEVVKTIQGTGERVEFLGKAYAAGSKVFEEDEANKSAIKDINYLVYAAAQRFASEKGNAPSTTDYLKFVHDRADEVEEVYKLWKETRGWSLDYFETIYARVGSHFDRYYFEGECLAGVDLAREAVKKGVLKEDAGAIIFDGKPYGLDTRVFVNSLGLPTYEAKELALSKMETTEFGELSKIIHVVGPEQSSFFKVTFKAEELLGIVKPGVQYHLAYGWVKLKHGKMSSRSGNVVLGEWLLDEAKKSIYTILEKSDASEEQKNEIANKAAVAAVKYSFLRVSTQSEIAFDLAESISFQGDSGPYLQYTYARAKSVLRKAASNDELRITDYDFNPEERAVARLILYFPEIVEKAAYELSPSHLCTYLFQLAQSYNLLYAKHEILSSPSRLALTAATAQVLANGLYLLGIETLEQM